MALQDILKKILLDAETEVAEITSDLEKKKKVMEAESKVIEAQELQSLEAKTASALSSIEEKTSSMARRENARMLLESKQEVIKALLTKFQSTLEELSEKDYSAVITKLISDITDTEGIIVTPSSRLVSIKAATPAGMTIETDESIKGGFIFKSKTGGEVDNSFASLVHSEFRSNLEMYFAEQLKFI